MRITQKSIEAGTKKELKPIGVALLFIICVVVAVWVYIGRRPAAPKDYQKSVETGSAIEAKYMSNGGYEVSIYEETALQVFKKYVIYYPSELETAGKQYPVIVICNGSGTPVTKYPAVPKHYASWGFIVIGTEEEYAWNGFAAEMSIRHLQRLNDARLMGDGKTNLFYQKIDLSRVGIVGHSQGGAGVLNAVTAQKHKDIYQAAVCLSPTNKELADGLEWTYDAAYVDTPILLISGAGGGDDWVVTGKQLESIYSDIAANKVMARRKSTVHSEMLYSADGYVTAWFMWHLQGDGEAAGAFAGTAPDLLQNPLYQDQHLDIGPYEG